MTERKATPDILGQILSGSLPPDQSSTRDAPASPAVVVPPRRTERRRSQVRAGSAPDDRWEYLTLSFQEQNGWRARFADGEELTHWENGPQLHDLFDALGDDGWELIAVTSKDHLYGRADALQAFFKRRKG